MGKTMESLAVSVLFSSGLCYIIGEVLLSKAIKLFPSKVYDVATWKRCRALKLRQSESGKAVWESEKQNFSLENTPMVMMILRCHNTGFYTTQTIEAQRNQLKLIIY